MIYRHLCGETFFLYISTDIVPTYAHNNSGAACKLQKEVWYLNQITFAHANSPPNYYLLL